MCQKPLREHQQHAKNHLESFAKRILKASKITQQPKSWRSTTLTITNTSSNVMKTWLKCQIWCFTNLSYNYIQYIQHVHTVCALKPLSGTIGWLIAWASFFGVPWAVAAVALHWCPPLLDFIGRWTWICSLWWTLVHQVAQSPVVQSGSGFPTADLHWSPFPC